MSLNPSDPAGIGPFSGVILTYCFLFLSDVRFSYDFGTLFV